MRIRVRFFAVLRQKAGVDQLEIELPENANAGDASVAVGKRMPELAEFLPKALLAVNREYAEAGRPLKDGDELALLPAVSGGL